MRHSFLCVRDIERESTAWGIRALTLIHSALQIERQWHCFILLLWDEKTVFIVSHGSQWVILMTNVTHCMHAYCGSTLCYHCEKALCLYPGQPCQRQWTTICDLFQLVEGVKIIRREVVGMMFPIRQGMHTMVKARHDNCFLLSGVEEYPSRYRCTEERRNNAFHNFSNR